MSLLMEALRKAEEAKRRMQQEEQAVGKGFREEADIQNSARDASRAPDSLFSHEEREQDVTPDYILENFTDNSEAGASTAPNGTTVSANSAAAAEETASQAMAAEREATASHLARRQQRTAAASVFVAKQNPARNRKTLTILVIVMLLMIPTGGAVLWYLQTAARPSIGVSPAIASYDLSNRGFVGEDPTPAATDTAQQVTVADAIASATVETANAEQPDSPEVVPAEDIPSTPALGADDGAKHAASAEIEMAATVAPPQQTPAAVSDAPTSTADSALTLPETSTASVLEVSRSRGARQLDPGLSTAYATLQTGDLTAAGEQYQRLLDQLPGSRDALLGLALVRLRQGELASARELYARALQLNPRDPLAHTGLLQTMRVVNPAEHESTLQTLINQYPEVPQLSLALGNHFAAQQRWSEAQGAYYNALLTARRNTSGPVHPDYAFNLAVSLEQLNQRDAALDYYRQAQALARDVAPGFDPQLLSSRLVYLEQDRP